ncbi:hypothetical protein ACTXT7_001133 [Hymenolepis weldensis]
MLLQTQGLERESVGDLSLTVLASRQNSIDLGKEMEFAEEKSLAFIPSKKADSNSADLIPAERGEFTEEDKETVDPSDKLVISNQWQ